MKHIIFSCAAIYGGALLAAAHIYSPSFGAFVKTGPGITLDASVSSANTPGSCDFNPAAHPYLKRPEATAFYALFDNYYAHQVSTREWDAYRTCSPFASHRPVNDHAFLTVTTNALFNYSALMTCADNLVNKTYGDGYYLPFYRADQWTTSSAFDGLFGSWDTSSFQSVITLDNWRILSVISDLDDDDVFHYRFTDRTPWGDYREPIIKGLFRSFDGCGLSDQIYYNEYSTSGDTVTDHVYNFYDNQPHGHTFKGLADSTWPDNDIYQITNRSLTISWKPLCAISQTLALMDSAIEVGEHDYNLWSGLKHHAAVNHRYSKSAESKDCGSATFTIDDHGSFIPGTTPRPIPSSIQFSALESTNIVRGASGIFYALRVGASIHDAGVTCATNIVSESYEEFDIREILDSCGFTNRNVWCILDVEADFVSVTWPYYYASLNASVNEGPSHYASSLFLDISDMEGDYSVKIEGGVSASYSYTEDDPFALNFDWDEDLAQKENVESLTEYAIISYAVTKYASGTTEFWFDPIDFGYHPPSAKPSPVDDTMKYGYLRDSFETDAINYDTDKYLFDLEKLNDAKTKIHEDVMAITGGDYGDPEPYLGLTESAVRNMLGEFEFTYAEMEYPRGIVAYQVYVSSSGSTTPEKIRYHPNATILFHYSRPGGSSETIHRAAGGDAKMRAAQKYKMAYPSLRTY